MCLQTGNKHFHKTFTIRSHNRPRLQFRLGQQSPYIEMNVRHLSISFLG